MKVLLLGEDENPQSVRVELSSEADLFFLYVHELDEQGFAVSIFTIFNTSLFKESY